MRDLHLILVTTTMAYWILARECGGVVMMMKFTILVTCLNVYITEKITGENIQRKNSMIVSNNVLSMV